MDYRPNTYTHIIPGESAPCGSSYRYNTALAWVDPDPTSPDPNEQTGNYWSPLTEASIQNPTDTFVAAEPAGHWHNAIALNKPTYHYNGVCVDGHAKSVSRAFATDTQTGWSRPRRLF
jgi:hypothetical protein